MVLGIAVAIFRVADGQHHGDGGDLGADKGKVLAAAGDFVAVTHSHGGGNSGLTQQLRHILHGAGGDFLIGDVGGTVAHIFHIYLAAVGLAHRFGNFLHALHQHLFGGLIAGADGALHDGGIGNHIGSDTGLELAGGDDAEGAGGQLTGVDLGQGHMNVSRGGDGVDSQVGHGTVAALALDGDLILVAGSHATAAVHNQHNAVRHGHASHGVDHHGGVHMGILQHASLDAVLRALQRFLAGLEQQLDGTLKLILMLLQQLGGAQHHGRMGIMAAGMHLAGIFRGEIHFRFLLNGQRVHISPDQKALAGLLAPGQNNQPARAAVLGLITHFLQLGFHKSLGKLHFQSQLRVLVQLPAVGLNLRLQGDGFLQQFLCVHS